MPLDPQVQAIRAAREAGGHRQLYDYTVEEARAQDLAAILATAGTPEPVALVEDRSIPGPDGDLPIRIYRPQPAGTLPVLVYFFGGGWTLGTIDTSDAICRSLANAAGCAVVAVGYRLAPEHKFPAAVDDCHAAVDWIARHGAALGLDPDRLAVGGDSAGGNLAAGVTLRARDGGGPEIAAQLLVYPNTDYRSDTPSRRENNDPYFFNARSAQWYWDNYLADPEQGSDPLASPLRAADHGGLPPALVITAEYDPLRDEGEAYARKLAAAGVAAELTRYPGVVHGFFAMGGVLDAGRQALAQAAGFLRDALAAPEPAAPEPAVHAPAVLDLAELHGSVSDPLLDAMNFLNEVTGRFPDALSFAPGRPYEGFFDVQQVTHWLTVYTDHLRKERGYTGRQVDTELFQYGRTSGLIQDLVARTIANDESIVVPPESVVVTVGCQEGMLIALRALCATPADVLLVSSPCYVGVTGAASLLGIPVVTVPEGPHGLDPAAVAEAARRVRSEGRRPRALYLVPDFANPSGTSLSHGARRDLLDVAEAEDLLLLEDNPYGFFSREGEPAATLKSMDTGRRVVYLGSFAKTAFPGARVGYVVADQEVRGADGRRTLLADELSKIKSMTTVNTPTLSQAVIGGLLIDSGFRLREANAGAIAFYRANLETLLAELERHFPAARRAELGIGWNRPAGGYFLTMTVPFTADQRALERSAREFGVLWTPMSSFYPDGSGTRLLRLSCSYLSTSEIEEGVRRLASFVASECATAAP
ncbi:aminotransferase class I/II-fold pyridoxal phosphate-dependent enzyme [Kitasatospora cineracea]|uniref:Acetyl esterase/lipase n=1 Tax=Kitasatospora cineracea TaxID=88074 RepID=A0A3N4R794_9ACTN|nr:aminotransferase class I/II-fold pyridoxal phosphate-dependent enzyme [Kitasatospora cineracea]RPE28526.1 acetyl esterase/lipase [Kitasatospora cineracea]